MATSRMDLAESRPRAGSLAPFLGWPLGWLVAAVGLEASGILGPPREGSWPLAVMAGVGGAILCGVALAAARRRLAAEGARGLLVTPALVWAAAALLAFAVAGALGDLAGAGLGIFLGAALAVAAALLLEPPPGARSGRAAGEAALAGLLSGIAWVFAAWVALVVFSLFGATHPLGALLDWHGERLIAAGLAGALGGTLAGAGTQMASAALRDPAA